MQGIKELESWRKVPYEKFRWYEYRRHGENGIEIRLRTPQTVLGQRCLEFGWNRIADETNNSAILNLVMSYFDRGTDV